MLTARACVNVRVLLHATPPRVRALLAHTPRMHARTPSQSATRAASRGHADGARGATSALALARGKARRGAARVWRPQERALAPARRAREQWRACRALALERAAKKSTGGVGGRAHHSARAPSAPSPPPRMALLLVHGRTALDIAEADGHKEAADSLRAVAARRNLH